MARLPRFDLADHLHLIVQRARPDRPPFVDTQDRERYLSILLDVARSGGVAVHAYVLLEHELRLLVTPTQPGAISSAMQSVGRRYVKAFNHRHGRTGALWDGRYRCTVVEAATQFFTCVRLIEHAPVRERLVAHPADWPWSSAAHHLGLRGDALVSEHASYWQLGNTPFEREVHHGRELAVPLSDAEVTQLLNAAARGWPIGPPAYIDEVAKLAGRPARPRPRGRPRRK